MTNLVPKDRRVLWLLYIVAAVILVDQALEVLSLVWPLRFGLASWRFGALGLALGKLEFLALADALLLATAVFLEHRRFLRILGLLHALVGLVVLAALGVFLLDGIQLRGVVQPERRREMTVAGVRSLMLGLVAGIACLVAGVALWWAERGAPKREQSRDTYLVAANRGDRVDE